MRKNIIQTSNEGVTSSGKKLPIFEWLKKKQRNE